MYPKLNLKSYLPPINFILIIFSLDRTVVRFVTFEIKSKHFGDVLCSWNVLPLTKAEIAYNYSGSNYNKALKIHCD